jgi:hypothetical protein
MYGLRRRSQLDKNQLLKAREAKSKDGRPIMVLVPSGEDKAMHVSLAWHSDGVETTCQCRGSRNGLCYHQLAAVLYSLRHAIVHVTKAKGNAKRLTRLGGYVYGVCPENEGPAMWLVVRTRNNDMIEQEDLPGELCPEIA